MSLKLLCCVAIIAIYLINIKNVQGWSAGPGTYTVGVENGLDDVLWVHCKSGDSDLKLQKLPISGKFSWEVKTSLFQQRLYFCGLTWYNHGRKVFDAFVDNQEFVDLKCGGRHCLWKALKDGIYLYQNYKGKYIRRYTWDKFVESEARN